MQPRGLRQRTEHRVAGSIERCADSIVSMVRSPSVDHGLTLCVGRTRWTSGRLEDRGAGLSAPAPSDDKSPVRYRFVQRPDNWIGLRRAQVPAGCAGNDPLRMCIWHRTFETFTWNG